jgi:Flp pilus assembly protein TadG
MMKTNYIKLRSLLSALASNARGNIIILMAISMPVFLGVAGLAIDVNRFFKLASHVQFAADQAAVAAAAVDGTDRKAVAIRFFNASLSPDISSQLQLTSLNVNEDFPPGGPLSVSVEARVAASTQFGSFVGLDSIDITRGSVAARQVDNVEVAVTIASSGTMCSTKSRVNNPSSLVKGDTLLELRPDPACTNFEAQRAGVNEFVDLLESNETVADLKVGLIPFNHKVRMPNLGSIPPTLSANEPGFFNTLDGAMPLSPVLPLTSDLNVVRNAIADLRQTPEGRAWGRTDLSTHVAGLMLDPNSNGFFGGDLPQNFGDPNVRKVVILMTDGANIGCCFTNHTEGNFSQQYVYYYQPYNDQQLQVCDALKNEGVEIYSILFNVNETDPGGIQINNVFARCASGVYSEETVGSNPNANLKCSEKQNCYNVPDHEALREVYRQIAQTFYQPRLTQ